MLAEKPTTSFSNFYFLFILKKKKKKTFIFYWHDKILIY